MTLLSSITGEHRLEPVLRNAYRDLAQNALSDSIVSQTEYDYFPARIDHSNTARMEHAAPVDAAFDGHLVRYRYPKNCWRARDADACYRASFYPAYRHYWQQTQFQSKLIHSYPKVLLTTDNFYLLLQISQDGDVHLPPRLLHH